MPNGKYLMEDFCYAGGLPVVLRELGEHGLLHKKALTVNGKTIWENNKNAECFNRDVITAFDRPFKKNTGIAVLRGNLCPDGAIIKPSAATPKLMKHKGRAVVFKDIADFHARIDDPKLDIDEHCVMVLQNCGPKGYPGMAEVGNMPLPPKVLKKGITDMVRISDARMSGTAYGTVVLHIAPEAAAGGALGLVRDGDIVELDVAKRKLHLHVSAAGTRAPAQALESARSRRCSAATTSSTSITCCRPTRAPIWIFSSAKAVRACRKTTTSGFASGARARLRTARVGTDGRVRRWGADDGSRPPFNARMNQLGIQNVHACT